MKHLFILCLFVFSALSVAAQEMNFTVSVNTPKLQTADPKIFEALENDLREFLNNTSWTNDIFSLDERIKCNITIYY